MSEKFDKRWDGTCLPVIPKPPRFDPDELGLRHEIEMDIVVAAIQNGESHVAIKDYFSHFTDEKVRARIHGWVNGFPAIFYAVQTNDEKMIRVIAESGGDVDASHGLSKIPLLAFAVVSGDTLLKDTTPAVITLLSLGASAEVFPKAFYTPYNVDLPPGGPIDEHLQDLDDSDKQWCKPMRAKVAAALNLSQRYYLNKSTKVSGPSSRDKQITVRRNASALLGIPYLLIGQIPAAKLLKDHLLGQMLENRKNKHPKPLVLAFAGPSGHGKTELAKQLGHLLSLEIQVVDCTVVQDERELFGARSFYKGSDNGTNLNDFLSKNEGQTSIVVLDEFEKTSDEIRNAFLIPFDEGKYENRRYGTVIDTTRTIWIIATNAVDAKIMDFWDRNKAVLSGQEGSPEQRAQIKKLCHVIRNEFKQKFKAPVTGRIDGFIPFLPFTEAEQSVGAHKYLLQLVQRLKNQVKVAKNEDENMVGDVRLHIKGDATVCTTIARDNYDRDLGIRSLKTAIKIDVEQEVYEKYREKPHPIADDKTPLEYHLHEKNRVLQVTEKLEYLK